MTPDEVLRAIPQQAPFRFIDRILEVDSEHIVGSYTFRHDEFFYRGHFPGDPVTPGAILIETMAQTGVVALGIYLAAQTLPAGELSHWVTLFTECEMEFHLPVAPGERVTLRGEKVFFRRMKLKSRVELLLADGRVAAEGTLAGVGVKRGS
ncbi:MAG: beta-hydroxyacyl-ACP dehydratase [Proteobacteria bacterium]|jgi:3-hydroxyacyl-[acyl-carrier-protein] dehydratase|nr:beta-hydroxyacyl-ACP dehydratase [Pseudomonadota bacterium]